MSTNTFVSTGYHLEQVLDPVLTMSSYSDTRPWYAFTQRTILPRGNNKTNPTPEDKEWGRRNVTEIGPLICSVRGCPYARVHNGRGCYGDCYMCENKLRYHVMYWVPVGQHLDEKKFYDACEIVSAEYKWIKFFRDGESGDPSAAWDVGCRTSEIAAMFDIPVARLTKFWVEPTDYELIRQADCETVIHGSVSALDPSQHRERILRNLERIEEIGGRYVHRVITAPFMDHEEELWDIQNDLMGRRNVFEQPLRVRGTNPFLHLLDVSALKPTLNHTKGIATNKWKSAGGLYGSRGCYSHKCYLCRNKCMTADYLWGCSH